MLLISLARFADLEIPPRQNNGIEQVSVNSDDRISTIGIRAGRIQNINIHQRNTTERRCTKVTVNTITHLIIRLGGEQIQVTNDVIITEHGILINLHSTIIGLGHNRSLKVNLTECPIKQHPQRLIQSTIMISIPVGPTGVLRRTTRQTTDVKRTGTTLIVSGITSESTGAIISTGRDPARQTKRIQLIRRAGRSLPHRQVNLVHHFTQGITILIGNNIINLCGTTIDRRFYQVPRQVAGSSNPVGRDRLVDIQHIVGILFPVTTVFGITLIVQSDVSFNFLSTLQFHSTLPETVERRIRLIQISHGGQLLDIILKRSLHDISSLTKYNSFTHVYFPFD